MWGLLLSTRLMGKATPAAWLLEVHRFLGALSGSFVAVHLVSLWLDDYVHFAWAELFVPGMSEWKAEPVAWKSVLGGKTDPIVGLMGGKLKLAKGSLFALLPYAKAAKELVKSAIDVDTSFPDGW